MKYSARQHLRMAALLETRSNQTDDPRLKEKRLGMANTCQSLARSAAILQRDLEALMSVRPATSDQLVAWAQYLAKVEMQPDSFQKPILLHQVKIAIADRQEELGLWFVGIQ